MSDTREVIASARRVVVKIGSSAITSVVGGLDRDRLDRLVDAIEARMQAGSDLTVVSSGAVGAGLAPLGLTSRPRDLATKQAAASVGQPSHPQAVQAEYERRRQERLAQAAFLTDFRLTVETLAKVLGLRNKIIVDADKLPGKRHLMMIDPEWFRPPPPVFLPGDRLPPRRPIDEGP